MMKLRRLVWETLEKFFGKDWLNRQVGKVHIDGYYNSNPMILARMNLHPVIRAMIETNIKMAILGQQGASTVPIGRAETFQKLLHENLFVLEDKLDFPDTQRRLRDRIEFPKIEYELAIAAGYTRMGYNVDFIPRQVGTRTGEFSVKNTEGAGVVVECKKKDMTLPPQKIIDSWWKEFQHLTIDALKKIKKCYGVVVFISLNPERSDTHTLKDEIVKKAVSDLEGEFTFLDGKYKVILKRFCDQGESIPSEIFENFKNSYSHDHGIHFIKHNKNAWPLGKTIAKEYFDPIGVFGKSPSEFVDERVLGIMSTLGDAYGQLSEESPNLVYVDINVATMTPQIASKVLTQLLPSIEKKLNHDYSKISAVVITNLKILGDTNVSGFHAGEYIIYNKNSRKKIPDDFKIYGDTQGGKSILNDIKELQDPASS